MYWRSPKNEKLPKIQKHLLGLISNILGSYIGNFTVLNFK